MARGYKLLWFFRRFKYNYYQSKKFDLLYSWTNCNGETERSQDVTGIYIFLSSKGFNGQQAQIYLHKYLLLRFWHPIPSLKNCLPLLICCSFPVVGCSRHLGVSTSQPVGVGFCYKEFSPRDADEERFKSRAFLDARTFLRVIMSFCLSPSTSANWRLSWEYRSCISFSSVSTAPYLPLSSNISFISSLISLKLCNTASSSPCCLKKELDDRSLVSC